MQQKKLAFIGAGNMSRSIISGLIQSGYDKDNILASNPSTPKLEKLQEEFGIRITQSNDEACEFADAIVLAVKPQMIRVKKLMPQEILMFLMRIVELIRQVVLRPLNFLIYLKFF